MNRNDFLNMIEDTIPVDRKMIGEVYELIDIFPYFQSAHMLLLKGLYNNKDVKFENQLRNSAIHVGDREVLYWLLKTKIPAEIDKTRNIPENNIKTEKVSDTQQPVTESTENNQEKDLKTERVADTKQPVTESTENSQGMDLKTEMISDTQQTVIESAKNSEYLINEFEKDSDEDKAKAKKDTSDQNPGHSIMIATEPDNIESAGVMFLLNEDTGPAEEKIFFMDPGFSIPDREYPDLLELDLDEEKATKSPAEESNQGNPEREQRKSKKQQQSELIDKFIIDNPRIEPNKDKTYVQNEDISRPFVEETAGLVTETLARIYVNQGYYSKAIDIYEKLSLKFPEKSSYFASQIEKVKEHIKK